MAELAPPAPVECCLPSFSERGADEFVEWCASLFQCFGFAVTVHAAGEAIINSSLGQGKPENQGIEAFIPLIESGVALYTWQSSRFVSLIIYTCKAFDEAKALTIALIGGAGGCMESEDLHAAMSTTFDWAEQVRLESLALKAILLGQHDIKDHEIRFLRLQ